MGSVSAWEKQSEARGGAVTNDPEVCRISLVASARGGSPKSWPSRRPSLAPLPSPRSQTHPLGIPPGYGTLWSSGRGRLLGGPRFLYAHRPFAVLARGSSLQC